MALMFADIFRTDDHVIIQQRDYTRIEHPQFFLIIAISCLLGGLLLLAGAAYTHFVLQLRRTPGAGPCGISRFGIIAFGLGLIVLLAAILVGAFHH